MSLELVGNLLFVLIKLTGRYSNDPTSPYYDLVYLHATTTDQIGKPAESKCTYPIPDSLILVKYIEWISARRDQSGDPPIILEYDREG